MPARPQNPMTQQPDDLELHFELDYANVPLSKLVDAQRTFLSLANAVGDSVAGVDEGAATWVVSDVKPGSLDVVLRPEPASARVPQELMPRIVRAVSQGMATLQRHAVRPANFNDRALQHARELARLQGDQLRSIEIRDGHSGTAVTEILATNVDLVLGQPIKEFGVIEGRLEAVSLHGQKRRFFVYDALSGTRVECLIGHRIPADEIGRGLEKRVAVVGEISYRDSGEIINISAQELEVFAPESELPTADEVRGILG